MQQNPVFFYRQRQTALEAESKRYRRYRNGITALKLLTFAVLTGSVWFYFEPGWNGAVGTGVAALLLFAAETVADKRIAERIDRTEAGAACCRQETDYLAGGPGSPDDGSRYADPTHPYVADLDVFGPESLYQAINRCVTPAGADRLATWLRTPCRTEADIVARQEAAGEGADRPEWMLRFRAAGMTHRITENDLCRIETWLAEPVFFSRSWVWSWVYALNGLGIAAWAAAIAGWLPFSAAGLFFVGQLLVVAGFLKRINRLHARLDRFLRAIGNYGCLAEVLQPERFESARMQAISRSLFGEGRNALRAFAALKRLLSGFDQRNNVLVAILLNGLYMRELHYVLKLDRWKTTAGRHAGEWIDALSDTDALVSLATFRFNHPDFTVPDAGGGVLLDAEAAGHPLLRGERVCNDFRIAELHTFAIVTGANMAGKSTFLRTVGVNLVLALAGSTVCCRKFRFRPLPLYTSMRTTDNLAKATSYFHAELLRLKGLVELAEREEGLFVILDEMLKGTNSHDKLNGSLRFLERLLELPIAGIVATHDLALGGLEERFPPHFRNLCFEIEHDGGAIRYDYRLRPGVSRNMNASILLEQMGLIAPAASLPTERTDG